MNEPAAPVTIAFRIPGQWSHPKELLERLPADFRVKPDALVLPDNTEIGFGAAKADNQFPQIFRSSCRKPPTEAELAAVSAYKVNIFLGGPGGSLDAARTMMKAGAAIVRAGGAGVFIDNCALAHGGENWLAMTEDGSPDAVSFAFAGIIATKSEVYTLGMHVLGLRDIIMKRVDCDRHDIVEVIRYLAKGDQPVGDGHIIADLSGPLFQAFAEDSDARMQGSPMYNPFGRLRLKSVRDIAEAN